MLLAEDVSRYRVMASPEARAICPGCKADVVAKCGSIKIWHWAHERVDDCDTWAEPESEWHAEWKAQFPADFREVVMGNHRADIKTPAGWVIELQHSSISAEDIADRERFYGRMVWVIDACELQKRLSLHHKNGYVTFRWKWPRQTWQVADMPIFFDFGDGLLLRIKKFHWHEGRSAGGWGRYVETAVFVSKAIGRRGIHRAATCNLEKKAKSAHEYFAQKARAV